MPRLLISRFAITKNSRLFPKLVAISACIGLWSGAARAQETPKSAVALGAADKNYALQSYAKALKTYEALQKANAVPAIRQDDIAYRVVVSLGKTQQWDRALAEGLDFVKAHRGSAWEPRALYWLGRLYLNVPHNGYRVGKKTFRGYNVPKALGNDRPVAVTLDTPDQRNAFDALEAAHVLYTARSAESHSTSLRADQIQLDFDLIRLLQNDPAFIVWASKKAWLPPNDESWKIDTTKPYDLSWPIPKKILYLQHTIGQLASAAPVNAHQQALALFNESLWLRQYQAQMRRYALTFEKNKWVPIPFPYQDQKPQQLLTDLIQRFPNDTIRDRTQYLQAIWLIQDGHFTDALKAFRAIVAERPQRTWTSDSKAQIAALLQPEVSVSVDGPTRPGHHPQLKVSSRNTAKIHFETYRIDLPALLRREKMKSESEDPLAEWNGLPNLISGKKFLARLLASGQAKPVLKWDEKPMLRPDLKPHNQTIGAAFTNAGAYLVVASVAGMRAVTIVPITDLMLIQKSDGRGALYYVTEAATGKPVVGANILVRHTWHTNNGNVPGVTLSRGISNAQGLVSVSLPHQPDGQIENRGAIAWVGERFALINPQYINNRESSNDLFKVYSTTDRTVYRPLQSVHFRQLLMQRASSNALKSNVRYGEYIPLANRLTRVVVMDPQGNVVHKERIRCNAFGSVFGQFTLPPKAPLGEYSIQVTLPKEQREKGKGNKGAKNRNVTPDSDSDGQDSPLSAAGNQFRVEEYKKPEYEVTVTPSADRVKLGQPTKAKIHAAYYFGGPVPAAKVTYRVYRNFYAPSYRFPEPYDYLYNNPKPGNDDTSYRNGEVVTQGKAVLDAQGDATITFATAADSKRWRDSDLSYTVEADVQDQSRRVISGTGALKATKHDVAVFLNFTHGYATQGDRVDVEVKTLNPSDKPVSVEGLARVYRQPVDPKGKETLVYSEPLRSDAEGYAQIKWQTKTSGYFRIAFETQDTDGGKVSGDTSVWVDGPELRAQRFLFQDIHLAVKNPYYQEGQMAQILLVTPEPACTVLLTREAEGRILEKRLVHISGRSLQVEMPITRRDVPNVFVSAVMVRGGEMFTASQELFVPPARQTLNVTVKADKARYAPGEKAHLVLQARDNKGRPLRAELSIAISDAALSYIQKDYAPDIRTYFYGDRRTQEVDSTGSPQMAFSPYAESTLPETKYMLHQMVMPDGMGQLTDSSNIFSDMAGYEARRSRSGTLSVIGMGSTVADSSRLASVAYAPVTGKMSYHLSRAGTAFNGYPKLLYAPDGMSGGMPGSGGFGGGRASGRIGAGAKMRVELYSPEKSSPSIQDKAGFADARIRSDFRDTAFWSPSVVTNAAGNASVDVVWPDNLTQWKARALGSTMQAQVGVGETRVTTKKDLLVQLETPRFVVERDIVTFSAVVHNDTNHESRIRVRLDLDNADVVAEDIASAQTAPHGTRLVGYIPQQDAKAKAQNPNRLIVKTSETFINLAKGGQQRVDWLIRSQHEGVMHARMTAQSDQEGDAAQTIIPVLVHGVERAVVQSGELKTTGKTASLTITMPEARKAGSSQLVVTLNPSLAGVMLDALPYLADYPYGCVEQTMSRFLPSVIAMHTLRSTGYDLKDLEKAQKRNQENARKSLTATKLAGKEPNSAYTYPNQNSKPNGFPAYDNTQRFSPIFDSVVINKMVQDGLGRLKEFQHQDGGWGWWKDDSSDPYMSAYVIYGLITCQRSGINVPEQMIPNGLQFLLGSYLKETDLQRMVYEARVLALDPDTRDAISNRVDKKIYPQRAKLSAYGKALLALTLHNLGQNKPADKVTEKKVTEKAAAQNDKQNEKNNAVDSQTHWKQAQIVLDNLENTVHVDEANGTANWDDIDSQWWRWYNNKVETNATILEAYTAIAPNAKLPALLVKWLVNNRRGTIWHDTHDTSLAINALSGWMRAHQELTPKYTLTVDLGGAVRRVYHVTKENALFFDNTFIVPDKLLQTGDQTLTITKAGTGACYFSATTQTFSLEEPIKATSNEIAVTRRYFRLIPLIASGAIEANKTDLQLPDTASTRGETVGETVNGDKTGSDKLTLAKPAINPFLTGQYEFLEQGEVIVIEEGTAQGPQYKRVALQPGEMVNSGDLLEVELALEAKNDYDYVLFEDMKPAGCEPVELKSGEHSGQGVYANKELRDEKVAFFITSLPQGRRVLSYRLRAETPGMFHVLPTNGYAMYAPEVRALSDEARIGIRDEEPSEAVAQ